MEFKVDILLSAKIQITETLEYYSGINKSLPQKFLEKLDLSYEHFGLNPYFQKRYKEVRSIPIPGFPYILLFLVDENNKQVKVISCFQTFQDPKNIRNNQSAQKN